MQLLEALIHQLQLSPSFITSFFEQAEEVTLDKKSFFVKQGQKCRYMGIVKSGALYAFIENEEVNEYVSDLYFPSSFITSYRSFLTQQPSVGSIRAYEPSTIYAFSFETYQTLLQHPDWLRFFKHVSDELFVRKCYKDNSLMKDTAINRYKLFLAAHPDAEQRFPQYLIASYLNIRPETLSRIKSLDLHQAK
jgi:CRP-like cAMP-binding protein